MFRKSVGFTIAAVFLVCFPALAQEPADPGQGFKKNAVIATIGTDGLMGAYSLGYERLLVSSQGSAIVGLWAKAGLGGWASWSSGGPHQSLLLGTMTGRRNGHLELYLGLARMYNRSAYNHAKEVSEYNDEPHPSKSAYVDIRATGSVGYRFQKPTSRFLFRAGLGYPETLYLGLGMAF